MASITCGNCGNTHHSVDEVKGCHIAAGKLGYRAAKGLVNANSVYENDVPSTVAPNDSSWAGPGYVDQDDARRVNPHRMETASGGSSFFNGGNQKVERVYLNVPYAEKDHAKDFGAKWDAKRKQWWLSADLMGEYKDELPKAWLIEQEQKPKRIEAGKPGLYRDPDGRIILLYQSQYVPACLGKVLHILETTRVIKGREVHETEWKREPGIQYRVQDSWRVSLEEAQEFGQAFGICMACGRILENDDSIAAGIGPKCAEKF